MTEPKAAEQKALDLLDKVIAKALKAGADAADAVAFESMSMTASCRLGEPEDVERSEGNDLGLRLFVGQRQAFVSSTDSHDDALDALVERAYSMAKLAPEDPYCGLADPARLAKSVADLDLRDDNEQSADALLATALAAEDAGRAVPGVTNSEGGRPVGAKAPWRSPPAAAMPAPTARRRTASPAPWSPKARTAWNATMTIRAPVTSPI